MASAMPQLGSKISLISNADIRYEGRLYTVDPQECTIALSSVRSFGTEDRDTKIQIAPQSQVYEYILFRGSDIKDIRVINNNLQHPNDPAIMQVQLPSGQHIMPHFSMPNMNSAQQPVGAGGIYSGGSFGNVAMADMGNSGPNNSMPSSLTPGSGAGGSGPYMMSNQHQVMQPPQQKQQDMHNQAQQKQSNLTDTSRSGTPTGLNVRKSSPLDIGNGLMNEHYSSQHLQQQQHFHNQRPYHYNQQQQQSQHHNLQQHLVNQPTAGGPMSEQDQLRGVGFGGVGIVGHKQRPNQQQQQHRISGVGHQRNNGNNFNHHQQQQFAQNYRRDGFGGGRPMSATGGMHNNHDGMGGNRNFNNLTNNNNRRLNGNNNNNVGNNRNWNNVHHGAMNRAQRGGGNATGNHHCPGQVFRQNFVQRGNKNPIKFSQDFDFEQANNKFEELRSQLSKVKINGETDKKDDSGNETGAGEHEHEEEEVVVGYDKTKSFFDNISCEAAQDRKNKNHDWRQERKLNSETFGVSSTRRGGYRGRGSYYNNNRNGGNFTNSGNNGGNGGGYNGGNRNYRGGNYRGGRGNTNNNVNGGTTTTGAGNTTGSGGNATNANVNEQNENNTGSAGTNVSKNVKPRALGSTTTTAGNDTTTNGQTISSVSKTNTTTDVVAADKIQRRIPVTIADVAAGQ